MLRGLFDNTTIPALSESIRFSESRHHVLVGNVANLDTPGYEAHDLPVANFQRQLAEAMQARREPPPTESPGLIHSEPEAIDPLLRVRDQTPTILRHDGVDVSLEQQVLEVSKNQFLHNLAVSVMGSQFRLLQSMISEHL